MNQPELLPHRHPAVLIVILNSIGNPGQPTSNHAYTEQERRMEPRGWNHCQGEPTPNGKRIRCDNGQVRKGQFLYRCGQCKGHGGWYGDPYDLEQRTIRQGAQKPSTFTIGDFATLAYTIAETQAGKYAIDHVLDTLERRPADTTIDTGRNEHPRVTQVRIALHQLAALVPYHHKLLVAVHVDQLYTVQQITFEQRRTVHDALTHLGRLLPTRWLAPRAAREQATDKANAKVAA